MQGSYLYPQDWVECGNRTPVPLNVMYDGIQWTLPPYPAVQRVPRIVADRACVQFPIMGTEDPYNPKDFDSLVFVRWNIDGRPPMPEEPVSQNTKARERIDRTLLPKDRQKVSIETYGRAQRPERPAEDPATHFTGAEK